MMTANPFTNTKDDDNDSKPFAQIVDSTSMDIQFDKALDCDKVPESSATIRSVFDVDMPCYENNELSLDTPASTTNTLGHSYLSYDLKCT